MIAVVLALLAAPAAERPPNVVLIVADDLGCYDLGCYGQKVIRTPHLDGLAADGVKFTRFYAGNAVCAPSRCALLTGKHMGHAAVRNNKEVQPEGQHPLPATETTLAAVLRAKGYATGLMGKWGLGMFGTPGDPLAHGFDTFYGYNCQRHAHTHYPPFLYRQDKRFDLAGNTGDAGPHYTQDLFEAESLAFVRRHKARPFFLYLPFVVPHVAIQVPDDALAEYKGKLGDDPAYDGKKGYRPHPAPRAAYAAMVTRMDHTVGRLLAELKALGLDDDTLVLFTSDNGPTFDVGGADSAFFASAGPLRGLKGSLYEGGLRVPFLARWPGHVRPGTTCDTPLYFPDVLPTLAAVAGAAAPAGVDGVSFTDALAGKPSAAPARHLYWEFPGSGGQQAAMTGDGRWKAVRQALGTGTVKTELYDLTADPGEKADVAAAHPAVVAAMAKVLADQHTPNAAFPLQAIDPPAPKK